MEKIKKQKKVRIPLIIASVFFAIYGISLVIPLAWGFIMSLKVPDEYFDDLLSFPKVPQFKNYIQAFVELENGGNNLFAMIWNSLWFSLGGTFAPVFTCMIAGYVCAKYKFWFCKAWYWIAIITMMIPIMGSLGSALKISMSLGLYDNPLTLITGFSALGSTFVISFAFFKGVDWGYAESAFIDGAGHLRVLFQIMLPQAISPMIALSLTIFISKWSDAQTPLIYLPSYPTLASGFYWYEKAAGADANYPVLFAGLFMSAIPIIVLYIAFQDKLMNLNMGGGLKG